LNFGKALRAGSAQPASIRKLDAAEDDVMHRRIGGAFGSHESFQQWRLHVGLGEVFARARHVINCVSRAVEIELPRRAEQFEGIFHVRGLFPHARRTHQIGRSLPRTQ
jgi:hypothetical protein